jgi:hypothetical protein
MQKLIIGAIAALLSFAAADAATTFDKPIDTKVVALPPDPANPHTKPNRTCWYYPGFAVKQVDLGEKGAAELAIARVKKPTDCAEKLPGEMIVKGDYAYGYYRGAKGGFAFIDAADGFNGGLPFGVFSAKTGKRLFEDSIQLDKTMSVALQGGTLVMRYPRVWLAPCSLMSDAKGCWKKIAAATGLPDSARPDCRAEYRKAMNDWPKHAESTERSPTVIGYAVEARYADGKLSFKPTGGRATCWLED